jgi:putative FmdB family regulatory protein
MPTYEYECTECHHHFDAVQKMADPPLKECPRCGKPVQRVLSGGLGILFQGSGFYVTDSHAQQKPAEKSLGEKPGNAKPAGEKPAEKKPAVA